MNILGSELDKKMSRKFKVVEGKDCVALKAEVVNYIKKELSKYFYIRIIGNSINMFTNDSKYYGSYVIRIRTDPSYVEVFVYSWVNKRIFDKESVALIDSISYIFK